MKKLKHNLIAVTAILAILTAVGAFFAPDKYWQPLLINVATTFFAATVGLVVVNIYLDKASRKGAVGSLLVLSNTAIAKFHNLLLDLAWSRFAKKEYSELNATFVKESGDVLSIPPDKRKWIYELLKDNKAKLEPLVDDLDKALADIVSLVGWDLDAELLTLSLAARNSIRLFRGIPFDGTEEAQNKTVKHMLDIDLCTQGVRRILMRIAEVEDDG